MMKLDVQMFGGRGASSSSKPIEISKKTKKIYKEYSYGKELVGYEYNGYKIEIENEQRRYSMYGTKKWYHVTLEDGTHIVFEKLSEAKDRIENDIKKKK